MVAAIRLLRRSVLVESITTGNEDVKCAASHDDVIHSRGKVHQAGAIEGGREDFRSVY
jgi:hypothetical protein